MSQVRIDKRSAMKRPPSRDRIWQAIRKAEVFTVADIEIATKVSQRNIREFIQALENGGYIKPVTNKRGREKGHNGITKKRGAWLKTEYKLIKDIGAETPRLTLEGKEVTQGIGNDQMWRTMKMLKQFTYKDLAISATTKEHKISAETAKTYCRYLAHAGYLVKKGQAYSFIQSKNTGPRAPMIQRVKQVYDPNLNEVVYTPEPRAI